MYTGQACSTCHGKKMIPTPDGRSFQRCPQCEGTGVEFDPGLFFAYELGPIALAGNASSPVQSVQILDRSFRWMLAAAQSTGAFSVILQDSRNKRPFMNQAIHGANFFGTAQNPLPLLTPFEFEKRGSILATITDLSGVANSVRLSFIGVELNDGSAQ